MLSYRIHNKHILVYALPPLVRHTQFYSHPTYQRVHSRFVIYSAVKIDRERERNSAHTRYACDMRSKYMSAAIMEIHLNTNMADQARKQVSIEKRKKGRSARCV